MKSQKNEVNGPTDPSRRQMLARVGSAVMIAGAAGLGTIAFYDRHRPVRRSRRKTVLSIPDHRVKVDEEQKKEK